MSDSTQEEKRSQQQRLIWCAFVWAIEVASISSWVNEWFTALVCESPQSVCALDRVKSDQWPKELHACACLCWEVCGAQGVTRIHASRTDSYVVFSLAHKHTFSAQWVHYFVEIKILLHFFLSNSLLSSTFELRSLGTSVREILLLIRIIAARLSFYLLRKIILCFVQINWSLDSLFSS